MNIDAIAIVLPITYVLGMLPKASLKPWNGIIIPIASSLGLHDTQIIESLITQLKP